MRFLNHTSLSSTLDTVSEALYLKRPIPRAQCRAVAKWIAGRQGLSGAYADTFAPTEKDTLGVHLFTGETIRTRAGMSHILGEEACRVLHLLNIEDRQVQHALARAVRGLTTRIADAEVRGCPSGFYCCGACTAAYWRNLANGLLPRAEERLSAGLTELANLRSGGGKWRRFPFFYTCLVLTEIGPGLAKAEMQYAALYWQRNLKKLTLTEGRSAVRRAAVGHLLLELCES